MDFYAAIRELVEEKKRLDRLIAALEAVKNGDAQDTLNGVIGSRRGRKAMGEQERREVSERMKRYWANRRSTAAGKTTAAS